MYLKVIDEAWLGETCKFALENLIIHLGPVVQS